MLIAISKESSEFCQNNQCENFQKQNRGTSNKSVGGTQMKIA